MGDAAFFLILQQSRRFESACSAETQRVRAARSLLELAATREPLPDPLLRSDASARRLQSRFRSEFRAKAAALAEALLSRRNLASPAELPSIEREISRARDSLRGRCPLTHLALARALAPRGPASA